MVDSLLGDSALNYVGHSASVHKASLAERRAKMHVKLGEVAGRNELAGGQLRHSIHREMRNGEWLSAITHCLNITELSLEEFRDNLCLRYGLMPKDIPVTLNVRSLD